MDLVGSDCSLPTNFIFLGRQVKFLRFCGVRVQGIHISARDVSEPCSHQLLLEN